MNETTNSRVEVEAMLRSVIQSSKGGVLISNLQKEYKLLVGKNVPFKMLGYPTIEAMLRDMPDIVRIVRNSAGEDVVNAVVDENTAHLASLVARQKPSKTVSKVKMLKRRPPKVPYGRKVQNSPYLPRMNHQNYNYKFYSNFPQFEYNYHNKNTSLVKRFDHQPSVPPPPPPPSPPPPLQRKVQIARKPIRNLPPRFLRAQRISSSSSSLSTSPPVLSIENFTDVCTSESEIAANNWVDDVACLQSVISEENVSNCDIIRSYAASKGLIATFRNLPLNTRELPYTYISMLVIDGQKFNSYPNDKPTIDEAEEEAARVAVESLDLRPGQKSENLKTSSVDNSDEKKLILDRIFKIIDGKQNGLWNMKVESVYKETYKEVLPPNWIQLIPEHDYNIHVNHVGENRSILYPIQKNSSVQNEKRERVKTPEPLILPDTEYWDIFVSYLTSTNDIAVQLIDYSEIYEKLVSEMHEYYKDEKPIQKIIEGQLYAAYWDNCWNRIRAVNVMEELAECYFVDHGDSEILSVKCLYELESRFAKLPFQAIKCQLYGLIDYADNKIMLHHLTDKDLILGKTLVAEVVNREEPISLILYDTSTEEDINLNQYLIEITEKETITPKLPKIGGITKVYLSHVDNNGDIYVQVVGPALELLQNIMNEFNTQCEKILENVKSLKMGKMYCINYSDNWYRAVVKVMPFEQKNKEIEMLCVDYGNSAFLPVTNIYELGQLNDILSGLPYQAIKCSLHGIPPSEDLLWSKKTAKHLLKLTPDHQIFLLKVVTEATTMNPAKVELFKRIAPSDELVSINQTLALCTDIFSSKEESVNNLDQVNNVTNEKTLKPLNLQTDLSSESPYLKSLTNGIPVQCFSLQEENRISKHYSVITPDGIGEQVDDVLDLEDIKPPVLPSVGEFFDVHIVHTAHPHYFICQSWKHGAELDLLYEEMQSFYSSEENTIDMDDCLLKRGQFYAGKYNDEWKRVWVSDIISEHMVSVYFVDYGGFQLIGLTDLQPLWKYFRCFPYQAIPAELYGVEPREKDWNPMHCMQFQKMVEGKEFVSVIKKKMPDNNTGFVGEKLSLCLIDTSHPDKDIYIDKLLHDAGIVKLVFQR